MLRLYNEQSENLEPFQPLKQPVTIYVCGITPYDTTHLGHAFTYLSFDVLIRYWEYLGYEVRYVQNVTDVDDDVLRKAKETGEDWLALGNRWTRHFIEDMRELNVRPPDYYPRATEVIPQMFDIIQRILDKKLAYVADGNVYFDVTADPLFGTVSHLPQEQWLPIANERGNYPDDPLKRNPLDFVLWQAQKPGEPAWQSPWGMGRPGWHIECSTMVAVYLGEVIDVHGGGADLGFPHHECETAQMRAATGNETFARFWLHTAMVRYQGEKMSKSLGNLIWVRDLMATHNADAVRILINSHPYYETWEYDDAELAPADDLAARLAKAVLVPSGTGEALRSDWAEIAFRAALDDNLNTRAALEVLSHLVDRIISSAEGGWSVIGAQQTLRRLGKVFGLRLDGGIEERVCTGWERHMRRFA